MNSADVRIGTSGWHYPAKVGGWNGVFYPKPRPKDFSELAFYASFFNFVEVNTTFYGQPRPEVTAQWNERTPTGFEFAIKLYQQFTHPRLFGARVARDLSRQLGTTGIPESAVKALVEANQADIDEFRRGIEPLARSGKLGPLLAQFPASFRATPEARLHLAALLRAFGGYKLAVELRHRSWSDSLAETRNLLQAFNAAWVWIDEPKFRDSVEQPEIQVGPFAYLRLHGRNAKDWWQGDNVSRYRYLYTAEELRPIAEQIGLVTTKEQRAYAALNNHPDARAVKNAKELKAMLRLKDSESPVALPKSLIESDGR